MDRANTDGTNTERKPKMAIVVDYMTIGGVEKVLLEAIKYLKSEYDITIESVYGDVAVEIKETLTNDVKIHQLNCKNKYIKFLTQLPFIGGHVLSSIIKDRYDVVLVAKAAFMMIPYGKIGKKTIFWNHGDKDVIYSNIANLSLFRKLNRYRLMLGYQRFDQVWVLNSAIKEHVEKAFCLDNVEMLPNPIDCELILNKSEEYIDTDIFHNDLINIVSVSRLSCEKGQERLIKAVEQLSDKYPCQLIIIGDGDEKIILQNYVKEKKLEKTIKFLGMKVNPYPYIKNADLLVVPSYTESFGLVIIEAMLLGVPVISTNTIGGKSLIDEKYGLIVENSTEGIFEGIEAYINDDYNIHDCVMFALERAKEYDTKKFKKKLIELLNQLN